MRKSKWKKPNSVIPGTFEIRSCTRTCARCSIKLETGPLNLTFEVDYFTMKVLLVSALLLGAFVLDASATEIKSDSRANDACPSSGMCPSGDSCCPIYTGGLGCCPYPNAVCCSDQKHCCPSYSICILGACFLPANKSSAIILAQPNNICPDGSYCPGASTCCSSAGPFSYACCSYSNAVCCSDGLHCCPSGTTCNLSTMTCDSANKMEKIEASVRDNKEDNMIEDNSKFVTCPGGEYACPDGQTCCKLASGEWGCCPLPQATCCSDGVHCCPSGSTCSGDQCSYSNNHTVPFSTKVPAISLK